MKKNFTRRGFTLIELIITLVLMGVMAFSLTKIFMGGFQVWTASNEQNVISSSARNAINKISQSILEASNINIPNVSYANFSYDADSNGSLEFCYFSLASRAILYRVTSATPLTIATGITNLSFSTFTSSSPTYSVEFLIDLRARDKGQDIEFRTMVVPRDSRQ